VSDTYEEAREEAREGPLESTAALLLQAREGDAFARDRLARRYGDALRRWAHGRLPRNARDLVDTDDIVQSTLMRGLNHLGTFESRGEGAFLAYLRQILLNQIRDEARRARRRPEHVELGEAVQAGTQSPLEDLIGRENLDRYESALARLQPSQREAVILRLELGFRYREIAEAMGALTPNAARMLVGRGLVRLAQLMGGKHEPE